MAKIVTLDLLTYYDGKIKNYIGEADAKAIKAVTYADNKLNFFKSEDTTGTADFSFDLPEEMFLDQTKTKLVNNFVWSDTEYPNSTDPSLDGEPVFVLAVKGDTTVSYSFVSLKELIDVFTGKTTATATTTVSADNEISVDVNVSAETGNILEAKADGLFVPSSSAEVGKKADKVTGAVEGNFAGLDADGNLTDSGKKADDFDVAGAAKAVQGETTETVKSLSDKIDVLNGDETVDGSVTKAVKALADGAVKANTDAITAINDPDTGAVATSKAYADELIKTYITDNMATNDDIDALF